MTATYEEVKQWEERGKKMGASHIISVCDTFDWDDYPVFVMPDDDLEAMKKEYDNINMQRINEVIDIA